MLNKSKYIWLIAPYVVFLGITYQFIYWTSFGVNIFQYIGPSDIVGMSINPMIFSAMTLISVMSIQAILFSILRRRLQIPESHLALSQKITHLKSKQLKVRKFFAIYALPISLLYLALTGSVLSMIIVSGVLIALSSGLLFESTFLSEFEFKQTRLFLISIIIVGPPGMGLMAFINATEIKQGIHYWYADEVKPLGKAIHIGHVSDFDFFIPANMEPTIHIAKLESTPLTLHEFSDNDVTQEKIHSMLREIYRSRYKIN